MFFRFTCFVTSPPALALGSEAYASEGGSSVMAAINRCILTRGYLEEAPVRGTTAWRHKPYICRPQIRLICSQHGAGLCSC